MRSYEQMARDLGLPYCRGINVRGQYCPRDHRLNGQAADGMIHYAERPVTRANTLAFLKLAAQVIDPSVNDDIPWRRVYRIARLANEAGRQIRARPGRLWRSDKAFVLAGVAGLPNSVHLRRQAWEWARR